jgi:6-phosphogluconate dehydrogenase
LLQKAKNGVADNRPEARAKHFDECLKEVNMKLGLIGLGKMGNNMAKRLMDRGHEVVGFDLSEENLKKAATAGIEATTSLEDLCAKLDAPRHVWVMVPHGKPTNDTVHRLMQILDRNDLIIDGGNSHYVESVQLAKECEKEGFHFIDCGVSGGVWGLEIGYNLMIGGKKVAVQRMDPIFKALAPEKGYKHIGENGSGHFVKMIHNALEYAMLQSMGEAFECLDKAPFDIDLKGVAALWQEGSVVRCWLLELLEKAFDAEGNGLEKIKGYIDDSGTARWTTLFAVENAIPIPTITQSLYERFDSRIEDKFSAKVIAALRNQFGGHAVVKS